MHLNLPLKKNLISINQIKRKTHLIITQNKRWKKISITRSYRVQDSSP
jgi:hypothetical protein